MRHLKTVGASLAGAMLGSTILYLSSMGTLPTSGRGWVELFVYALAPGFGSAGAIIWTAQPKNRKRPKLSPAQAAKYLYEAGEIDADTAFKITERAAHKALATPTTDDDY